VKTEELTLAAPDPRRHSEALCDLVAKMWPESGYYQARKACREVYFHHSHYDWQTSRIILLGDRVVTHWGVWDYQMRIGRARVRVGGIGAVLTDGDFRRRGLMDRTARGALEAMRAQGYDMSILFGLDNFYRRFGYVRAWPEVSLLVRTSDLPTEPPAGALRRFRPKLSRQDMREVYNAHHATATGTAVRPTFRRMCIWTEEPEGYGWRQEGRLAGYVLIGREGSRLKCSECCGDTEQVLRALGKLARQRHCDQLQFDTIPYMSELAKRLRRGNCRVEMRYRRNGSALACLLNLPSALTKMQGELSRRLRASCLATWSGDLLVADVREQVTLLIGKGRVAVVPPRKTKHVIRGGDEVVQLLLGTDEPSEVVEAGKMRLSGEAAELAEVLFPVQWPQLSQLDRY